MARVLVSGAGPSGLLAALALHARGHTVMVVEKRRTYTRGIVHQLRQSALDDLGAVPDAQSALQRVCATIRARRHGVDDESGGVAWRDVASADADASRTTMQTFAERLDVAPAYTLRIDAVERALSAIVERRDPVRMQLHYGEVVVQPDGHDVTVGMEHTVKRGAFLFAPDDADLVVIAEGGKPANAARLAREPAVLSAPRFYMNLNVPVAVGPEVRRIDGAQGLAMVVGHDAPDAGTWAIVEPSRGGEVRTGRATIDAVTFVERLTALCSGEHAATELEAAVQTAQAREGLFGTFRFAQQLLVVPAAGRRVVFFGDAAGMGHPATSGALEAAVYDLDALTLRAESGPEIKSQHAYVRAVREVRVALLEHGEAEYPSTTAPPLADRVAALAQQQRY